MIPLWVPLQSLTAMGSYNHLPTDPNTANIYGHQGAQLAVGKANIELGLFSGIIYTDEERLTSPDSTVTAFVAGFVSQLHSMGWRAGVYMSSYNWMDILSAWPDVPDDVWVVKITDGNYASGAYGLYPLPDEYWVNNQRLRQYAQPKTAATYGGFPHTLDYDYLDGEVSFLSADSSICTPSCDPCDPSCIDYDPSNPTCPAPPPVCAPDDPFCS